MSSRSVFAAVVAAAGAGAILAAGAILSDAGGAIFWVPVGGVGVCANIGVAVSRPSAVIVASVK